MIEVRILGPLRSILKKDRMVFDGKEMKVSELAARLGVEEGSLLVFVNGAEISSLDGMDTVVREGDRIEVLSTLHCSAFKMDGQVGLVHGLRLKGDPGSILEGLRKRFGGVIQLVDPGCLAGELHARLVLQQCFEAMKRGTLYAKKADIDLLMRICCTDQIKEALEEARVKGREAILLAILDEGEAKRLEEFLKDGIDDGILKPDERRVSRLMRKRGIGGELLSATMKEDGLPYLLAENAALLKL